ncbi:hypothetical protein J6590_100670, partial [Homalodisca vitripennis]
MTSFRPSLTRLCLCSLLCVGADLFYNTVSTIDLVEQSYPLGQKRLKSIRRAISVLRYKHEESESEGVNCQVWGLQTSYTGKHNTLHNTMQ